MRYRRSGLLVLSLIVVTLVITRASTTVSGECPGAPSCPCAFLGPDLGTCPEGNYCPYGNEAKTEDDVVAPCTLTDSKIVCPCTPGFYCPANSIQPSFCCEGYYCPTPTEVYECPSGSYCQRGYVEPRECGAFAVCDKGSDTEGNGLFFLLVAVMFYSIITIMFRLRDHLVSRSHEAMDHTLSAMVEKDQDRPADRGTNKSGKVNKEVLNPGFDTEGNSIVKPLTEGTHEDRKFTLDFDDVGFSLPNGVSIVAGVSGSFRAGRVTAVMGPSGAGKTTIMRLVAGKLTRTSGRVLLNGSDVVDLSHYRSLFGYVPQEDIMLRELTVRDVLVHSAFMRLPVEWSDEQRLTLVQDTLTTLGIDHVKDVVIGDARARGISGGQRKRTNIGLELVADPSILFLDEPTSGLDATASVDLCQLLHSLAAERDITVVAVVHQPSVQQLELFDDLLLLGRGGRTVYQGPMAEAQAYFTAAGFPLPPGHNPGDHFLNVTTGRVPREGHPDFQWEQLFDMWLESRAARGDEPEGGLDVGEASKKVVDALRTNQEKAEQSFLASVGDVWADTKQWFSLLGRDMKEEFGCINLTARKGGITSSRALRHTPGFLLQLLYCTRQSLLQVYRNQKQFTNDVALHFVFGLFLSSTATNIKFLGPLPDPVCADAALSLTDDCYHPQEDEINPRMALVAWAAMFAGVAAGIDTFGHEMVVFWRASASGTLTGAYFCAKWVADWPRIILSSLAFTLGFFMLYQSSAGFNDVYAVMLLYYLYAFAVGYILVLLVDVRSAPLYAVGVSLVAATFLSASQNPTVKDERDYIWPARMFFDLGSTRWALEALYVKSVVYYETVPSGPLAGQPYMNLTSSLDDKGYDMDNYPKDLRMMFLDSLFVLFLAFLVMKVSNRDKKK